MHGWENELLRKEGLKEVERLINHPHFLKSRKLLEVFYKYYSEGRENQIQQMMDLSDASESLSDPEKTIGKRRDALKHRLESFYKIKQEKGNRYQIYFVENKWLGIRDMEEQKEKITTPPSKHQELSLSRIKEILLDFILIYPEAYFLKPSKLVDRCKHSKSFNFDSIIVLLISVAIAVATFKYYFGSFKLYAESLAMSPVLIHYFINIIVEIEKLTDSIFSLQLLFTVFRFSIFSFIIPWAIYIKLFRGTASIYEVLNYQFYYLYCWLPLICWLLLSGVNMTLHHSDMAIFWIIIFCVASWFTGKYWVGFNKLMGFTFKKGIIPFIIYVCVLAWFVKTF